MHRPRNTPSASFSADVAAAVFAATSAAVAAGGGGKSAGQPASSDAGSVRARCDRRRRKGREEICRPQPIATTSH